jgi:uncharacterized protein (TIGR02996 family)
MAEVEEKGFLKAIKENPGDVASRLAYADWLEEHGRRHDAILQRAAANVSWVVYKIRRKSDGLYSDGRWGWNEKGKSWQKLGLLKQHISAGSASGRYYSTLWAQLEIAVFEMPLRPTVVLSLSGQVGGIVLDEVKRGGSAS